MDAVNQAFERNAALILASENWAQGYSLAPVEHAKLIKASARLERKLLLFFKQQAAHSMSFVNWYAYATALQEVKASMVNAYDVQVIVNDNVANDNDTFIKVVFDEVALATGLGVKAGSTTYGIHTDLTDTSSSIQRQARKQVAELVGRKVLDDGSVVPNPNAKYVISNTTRKRIQDSIHTSLMLGEDVPTAAGRIKKIIKDPKRAALIAHQELGMAYTTGVHMYGEASKAVGKEWQDNGAIDICRVNTTEGPIPFDEAYPSGDMHPLAHIGCKCYERLIYQDELDANPNLFGEPNPVKPKVPIAPAIKPKPSPVIPPEPFTPIASFNKGGKEYTFDLNNIETHIISDNNITMSTQPPPGRSRWPASTHGMYSTRGTYYKSLHLRNPAEPTAKQTFFHEIGHAIDHNLESKAITDRYANAKSPQGIAFKEAFDKDYKAIYEQRMRDSRPDFTQEQFDTMMSGNTVHYTKNVGGRTVSYVTRIPLSYRRYATSPSEIFAHGYGYYRTNPDLLKRIAPNLYKFYGGLK